LTRDKVTCAGNKTAVDFGATRCSAYGPGHLTVLRSGGEEGCGQTRMLPPGQPSDQLQQASITTLQPLGQLQSLHCKKDLFALRESTQGDICADTYI